MQGDFRFPAKGQGLIAKCLVAGGVGATPGTPDGGCAVGGRWLMECYCGERLCVYYCLCVHHTPLYTRMRVALRLFLGGSFDSHTPHPVETLVFLPKPEHQNITDEEYEH